MKKVKCDFCGNSMSVKPGQSTFCRKCNTDYSAEQIGQMLLKTELSGDFFEDEPPLDKSIQRRIMLNYLEKRKRDLEWKRKRRFMLTKWWLKNFNDRPLKRPEDGVFFFRSTNLKFHEAQMNLATDYAYFNKGEYFIRCAHCSKKFPIKKEASVFVCPNCHKYTEL